VFADLGVFAEQEVRLYVVGQPRIVDTLEIPQVMMSVDDARRTQRSSP
jgi:hypothetical protein